jgi:uncharacterized protein YjeT (DUF2065 family)
VASWSLLFLAFGLALFLEGLPYFVSPPGIRRVSEALSRLSDGALRSIGITMMAAGLLVAYLATR